MRRPIMTRYCKLKQKEVVNIADGRSLGFISDLLIEEGSGQINAIVLVESCGFLGLIKPKEFIIPWRNICKIGDDVILVETDLALCRT